jgi:hypothetical protein
MYYNEQYEFFRGTLVSYEITFVKSFPKVCYCYFLCSAVRDLSRHAALVVCCAECVFRLYCGIVLLHLE